MSWFVFVVLRKSFPIFHSGMWMACMLSRDILLVYVDMVYCSVISIYKPSCAAQVFNSALPFLVGILYSYPTCGYCYILEYPHHCVECFYYFYYYY